MEKKIFDYARFYAGINCGVILRTSNRKFSNWGWITDEIFNFDYCKLYEFENETYSDFQLVLRPLSDMTEEEAEKFGMMYEAGAYHHDVLEFDTRIGLGSYYIGTFNAANRVIELLKAGFDLFGLIESNLALDKTKL